MKFISNLRNRFHHYLADRLKEITDNKNVFQTRILSLQCSHLDHRYAKKKFSSSLNKLNRIFYLILFFYTLQMGELIISLKSLFQFIFYGFNPAY